MTKVHAFKFWLAVIFILVSLIYVIRISGPDDFEDNSQHRNLGYVMDLLERGDWLAQRDMNDRIMSKPPLHTWVIGLVSKPFGLNRLTLTLPSYFGVLGTTFLVFSIGAKRFGLKAGVLSCIALVMTPMIWRQIGMVRSDALFMLAITGGACAAMHAWESGRGWTWFWVCAAAGLLTKGPLGMVISASGLLAWFWEKKTQSTVRRLAGSHLRGLALFVVICLCWVVPALLRHGDELIDKMIFDELLGHVASYDKANAEADVVSKLLNPTIHFITRFAPFSLFTVCGMWLAFRSPATDGMMRRHERFLVCWIIVGMVIFTAASHHRADLLLPLWPAGALLAGRNLSSLTISRKRLTLAMSTVCGVMLVAMWFKYHSFGGKIPKSCRFSQEVKAAAMAFRETGIDPSTIENFGLPTSFQYYLGTARKRVPESGESIGAGGDGPVRFGITGIQPVPDVFGAGLVREIFCWPAEAERPCVVRIFEVTWIQNYESIRSH